jgi:alpha-galactosidase/6-phospho-beta-glucosidase family protein
MYLNVIPCFDAEFVWQEREKKKKWKKKMKKINSKKKERKKWEEEKYSEKKKMSKVVLWAILMWRTDFVGFNVSDLIAISCWDLWFVELNCLVSKWFSCFFILLIL